MTTPWNPDATPQDYIAAIGEDWVKAYWRYDAAQFAVNEMLDRSHMRAFKAGWDAAIALAKGETV